METNETVISNNKLAVFFNRQREIIESAETPFSKLAIFFLPIIAPLVPAFMTGLHMYNLLSELFVFKGSGVLNAFLSCVVGVVLEMLGYVGAISFIKSIFDLVRHGRDEYLIPAVLTFLAYAFYLIVMFLINYQLGVYFEIPKIVNTIIGLLSFITVPTGLLSATHLSSKEYRELEDRALQNENDKELQILKIKLEEKTKREAIKQGINIFDPQLSRSYNKDIPRAVKEEKVKKPSDYKEQIWKYMDSQLAKGKIPGVKDITEHFHFPYDRAKGFCSTQRTLWAELNNIDLKNTGSTS